MSNNLTKEQIKQLLPHREPMLLLDQLVNIKKLHSLLMKIIKNLRL